MVIVNGNGEDSFNSFDLNLFASLGSVTATRTSASEQNVIISPPQINAGTNAILDYTAPPESITTITIVEAKVSDYTKVNLVQNGDFEEGNGNPNPWTLFFGENGGANQDYLRRGSFSGFIRTTDSDMAINQDIVVSQSKTYYLSAWCATSGPGSKFGIKVNDEQGPEHILTPSQGYKSYGISFNANAGDKVSVYLYAPADGSESFIDDPTLH